MVHDFVFSKKIFVHFYPVKSLFYFAEASMPLFIFVSAFRGILPKKEKNFFLDIFKTFGHENIEYFRSNCFRV